MSAETGEVLRAVFWLAKTGVGCESWTGGGMMVGMVSWVVLEVEAGIGDVMTVPYEENDAGVSGESGIVRG